MQVILAVPTTISLAIGLVACFVLTEVGVTLKGASFIIGLFTIAVLSRYGIWRFDKKATKISRGLRVRTGEVSLLWYLARALIVVLKSKKMNERAHRRQGLNI
jgi:hypothetical protein